MKLLCIVRFCPIDHVAHLKKVKALLKHSSIISEHYIGSNRMQLTTRRGVHWSSLAKKANQFISDLIHFWAILQENDPFKN